MVQSGMIKQAGRRIKIGNTIKNIDAYIQSRLGKTHLAQYGYFNLFIIICGCINI